MKDVAAWMPLYIGDYLADTMHLSVTEHGAYFLLICHYWRTGPLPDDDRKIAAICKATKRQWQEIGSNIKAFFHLDEGKLHHKRIDAELAKAAANSEKKRQAALEKWKQARCKTDADADADEMHVHSERNATRAREPSPSPSDTSLRSVGASLFPDQPKTPRVKRAKRPLTSLPEDWQPDATGRACMAKYAIAEREILLFKNHHIARGNLMADWQAAFRTWCLNAVKFAAERGQRPANGAVQTSDDNVSEIGF